MADNVHPDVDGALPSEVAAIGKPIVGVASDMDELKPTVSSVGIGTSFKSTVLEGSGESNVLVV